MSVDERKKQQKLARKKRKRKEQKAVSGGYSGNLASMASTASRYPIKECLVAEEMFATGIGTVIVARQSASGEIAVSCFMMDVFCLGAKNAMFKMLSPGEYTSFLAEVGRNETLKPIEPACARKLVEDCIHWAVDLGFSPHKDYQVAKQILANIDASACSETFEFGKDGKPFFIAGPFDNAKKSRQILATLQRSRGPGGSDFLIPLDPDS